MVNFTLFAIFFFAAIIFFIITIGLFIVFGKLMKLQVKRWFMASKGYVEVEHISDTKVRNYFILRPSKNKFDISDGFYHYIPECVSRKGDILRKFDQAFLSKVPEIDPSELEGLSDKDREAYVKRVNAEWEELRGLYKVVSGLKYDPQLLNRKFGMPVITYYGDNPDPFNPADRKKSYGSGVIKDMYLRLLLTQRFKDFQLIMAILLISWVVVAIALFGFWQVYKTNANSLKTCIDALNVSNNNYVTLVNSTFNKMAQGSTFVVGG